MDNGIIGRVSVGSKMDQIYIPKNRVGMASGSLVVIQTLDSIEQQKNAQKTALVKPFIYGFNKTDLIEPIKLEIINKIFAIIQGNLDSEDMENVIITGSFLEGGFKFNDIDIMIIAEKKIDCNSIKERIEGEIGIKPHFVTLNSSELIKGLSYDPLYENMLSKFISLKRVVFNYKRKINSQLLDAHLLKSKSLIDGFEMLNGSEKYYLTLNMIAILLFLERKRISRKDIDIRIKKELEVDYEKIKENTLGEKSFIRKYKKIYNKTLKLIGKHDK